MYADTVVEDKLVHKPRFIALVFAAMFALFFAFNLADTIFRLFLEPVIGDPKTSGFHGRFAVAVVLAMLFALNLVAIGFLPLRLQILVVWFELLVLFLGFFYTFDLSLEFIERKIGFMITRGLFTTLYVSAISIAIASVIAIIGAIAKLSSNGFAFAIASFYTSLFRGLPLILQVYLIYLGLPQLGYVITAVPRRHHRAVPLLRRLYDRDLPRRH